MIEKKCVCERKYVCVCFKKRDWVYEYGEMDGEKMCVCERESECVCVLKRGNERMSCQKHSGRQKSYRP